MTEPLLLFTPDLFAPRDTLYALRCFRCGTYFSAFLFTGQDFPRFCQGCVEEMSD